MPHLHATVVVVANDRVAADPLLSGILQAGASGVRVEVVPVAEAARRGAGTVWERDTAIVLFESLQDARRALAPGLAVARLNLGGLRHDPGRVCVCDGVTLDHEDCAPARVRRRGSRGRRAPDAARPHPRAAAPLPEAEG